MIVWLGKSFSVLKEMEQDCGWKKGNACVVVLWLKESISFVRKEKLVKNVSKSYEIVFSNLIAHFLFFNN